MTAAKPFYVFDALRQRGDAHGIRLVIAVRADSQEEAREGVTKSQSHLRSIRFSRVIDLEEANRGIASAIRNGRVIFDAREQDGTPIALPDDTRFPATGLRTFYALFRWVEVPENFVSALVKQSSSFLYGSREEFGFKFTATDEETANKIVKILLRDHKVYDLKVGQLQENPLEACEVPNSPTGLVRKVAQTLEMDQKITLNVNFQVYVMFGLLHQFGATLPIAEGWWRTFDDRLPHHPVPQQTVTPERIAEIMTSALERNPSPETVHYALAVQAKLLSELGLPSPVRNS